jgi:hypothetical protein
VSDYGVRNRSSADPIAIWNADPAGATKIGIKIINGRALGWGAFGYAPFGSGVPLAAAGQFRFFRQTLRGHAEKERLLHPPKR